MKSEKCPLDRVGSGIELSYHQIQVTQFREFSDALTACEAANDKTGGRHYVVPDALGKDYYGGAWG